MATLSSFFGSSGGGGAAGVASTFRVFYETGSMTIPSCAVFAAYGVMGGGGLSNAGSGFDSATCRCSGGGGGFSWKEAAQTCASDFTVCAVVGNSGCLCLCCDRQVLNCCGGFSCVSGFSGGNICASGACGQYPGIGYGGDITNCGGHGGMCTKNNYGGAGAGGLYGQGGSPRAGPAGAGFGSGGGGGGAQITDMMIVFGCCQKCMFCQGPAMGGGGGTDGSIRSGGSGLSGSGGYGGAAGNGGGCQSSSAGYGPSGGLIPQYTLCGYSQAKTFLSASGGGGGADEGCYGQFFGGQSGAPGGGGGSGYATAGDGGFGAGGASSTQCCGTYYMGNSGVGGGAPSNICNGEARTGKPGQGIAVVEYWVTTS